MEIQTFRTFKYCYITRRCRWLTLKWHSKYPHTENRKSRTRVLLLSGDASETCYYIETFENNIALEGSVVVLKKDRWFSSNICRNEKRKTVRESTTGSTTWRIGGKDQSSDRQSRNDPVHEFVWWCLIELQLGVPKLKRLPGTFDVHPSSLSMDQRDRGREGKGEQRMGEEKRRKRGREKGMETGMKRRKEGERESKINFLVLIFFWLYYDITCWCIEVFQEFINGKRCKRKETLDTCIHTYTWKEIFKRSPYDFEVLNLWIVGKHRSNTNINGINQCIKFLFDVSLLKQHWKNKVLPVAQNLKSFLFKNRYKKINILLFLWITCFSGHIV